MSDYERSSRRKHVSVLLPQRNVHNYDCYDHNYDHNHDHHDHHDHNHHNDHNHHHDRNNVRGSDRRLENKRRSAILVPMGGR